MNLVTEVELAETFKISVEQLRILKKRNRWPCVKFGRNETRFTEEQVAQIVARHAVAGALASPPAAAKKSAAATSQTKRSRSRSG